MDPSCTDDNAHCEQSAREARTIDYCDVVIKIYYDRFAWGGGIKILERNGGRSATMTLGSGPVHTPYTLGLKTVCDRKVLL